MRAILCKAASDNMPYEKVGNAEPVSIADEVPFEIPDSWEWCHLSDCTYHVGSKENQIQTKDVKKEGMIPVVSQSQILIDGYHLLIIDPLFISDRWTRTFRYLCDNDCQAEGQNCFYYMIDVMTYIITHIIQRNKK